MPTYEYIREDGSTFEIIQKMSAEPLKKCPTTGQKVTRAFGTGAGLIFKGSGFYETDYVKKSESGSKDSSTNTSSSGSAEKKSGSKTSDSSKGSSTSKKTKGKSGKKD